MFERLFAESGLSLDRLRSLLEVGATGSIAKAADGDPVRQSQYSRQIKELEDFFQTRLVERHGKGLRLTANGKALARISRFFMLGLSNFKRGCLEEEQRFSIGASAAFNQVFLLPVLANSRLAQSGVRHGVEIVTDDEIERRLHDLTLDFGIVTAAKISRPLQLTALGKWRLVLCVPKALHKTESRALQAFHQRCLPLALPARESAVANLSALKNSEPTLSCDNFLEARTALEEHSLAALLPDYLVPTANSNSFLRVRFPELESVVFHHHLAWNPRLLRLNPHAARKRDFLIKALIRS
jgi:DNA-binding transcriptional LysR family regulator